MNEGRIADSFAMLKEALPTFLRLGDVAEVSMGLRRYGWAFAADGRVEAATLLMARAEALREEIAVATESWVTEMDEKTLARIHARLDDAAFTAAWERGRSLTTDQAVELAFGEAG